MCVSHRPRRHHDRPRSPIRAASGAGSRQGGSGCRRGSRGGHRLPPRAGTRRIELDTGEIAHDARCGAPYVRVSDLVPIRVSRAMVLSIDQLLDPRTLLVVGAFVGVVLVAIAFLLGRAAGHRNRTRGEAPASPERRLALVESLDLDSQRKLVILRRDSVEHLVLVGGPSDLVVETAIERAPGDYRADLPPLRAVRAEPDKSPGFRAPSVFAEESALAREPAPLSPVRSAEPVASRGPLHAPPPARSPSTHAPFRAPPSSTAGEPRAASPVPPRRSAPSPGAAAGHFVHHRAAAVPPAKPSQTPEPGRENAPPAPPRSLATPVLRAPPPSVPTEPEPKPAEADLDAARAQAAATEGGLGSIAVAPLDEEGAGPSPPRSDAVSDVPRADADEAANPPREPQSSVEAEPSGGRDPIDRLEAEIARLLGRAAPDS